MIVNHVAAYLYLLTCHLVKSLIFLPNHFFLVRRASHLLAKSFSQPSIMEASHNSICKFTRFYAHRARFGYYDIPAGDKAEYREFNTGTFAVWTDSTVLILIFTTMLNSGSGRRILSNAISSWKHSVLFFYGAYRGINDCFPTPLQNTEEGPSG